MCDVVIVEEESTVRVVFFVSLVANVEGTGFVGFFAVGFVGEVIVANEASVAKD